MDRRGERAAGGERLPSEFRQDEQANTVRRGRQGGKRVGITTWAQPGQRTLDQEKQKQTGGAGKATQRVRVGGRSAAARRLARGRAPRTDTQEMDVSCGGGADDDDGGR